MEYFPLFFDLKKKPCLVVGGGEIATRKARLLARAGASIDVCACEVNDELLALVRESGGIVFPQKYETSILDESKYVLVVSATDNESVNEEVSRTCHDKCIPVNVVDSPKLCSVITPAILDRSPVLVAVSSGGETPVLARKIKSILEYTFPSRYGDLAGLASRFRTRVKQRFPNLDMRRRFWESVLDGPVSEQVLSGNISGAESDLESLIERGEVQTDGEVYLVGAGPGDPDLLTFKALRLMQKAEIVLYDRLVSRAVLDLVRKDADMIYVGKRRDDHSVPQIQINQMLLDYALQGKRVLRLKGGDPFIFGRGAEEIELLAENKVRFQVVPGITAASACASYAGIPLTHRDYSQSVRFITGHVKEGAQKFPWKEFVEDAQTLVFYMGLIGLSKICEQLIFHGKSADTPAALIERGTLPDQRVHVGTLRTLPEIVQQRDVQAPTLIIIGKVVSLQGRLNWYQNNGVKETP